MTAAPPDKLSIIVFSGDFAKIHYAVAMASAAAAIGRAVTLFFTMEALGALKKPDTDGNDGWRAMAAGSGGGNAGDFDDALKSRKVAHFEELLAASVELGVTVMVCEMGLRAMGLEAADLRGDIGYSEGGLVTFFNDASADGAMVFV